MIVRESKEDNNIFYICSLIECIARKTKNKNSFVVNTIGKEELQKIYELCEAYHTLVLEDVVDELIQKYNVIKGEFDNISNCKYSVPSYFDIGKVYKRFVLGVMKEKKKDLMAAIFDVYNSFVSEKLSDYNSSFYCDAPQNILNAYLDGKIE